MQTTFSDRSFARYAWGVFGFTLAVALWGAYVRATGSGAGCGQHWPLCNGDILPVSPTLATIIEFTHRVTSGISLAMVAILLVWAFRIFPRRHPARLGAVLSTGFLLSEALIGAAIVLLQHVAKNQSTARGISLPLHLINTLTLLACLALTAWWGMGKPPVRVAGRAGWMALASLGLVMLLGVSGAIAALGDTLFPAKSLSEAFAQDFDPASNLFVRLRVFHPVIAAIAGTWLVFYAIAIAGRRPDLRPRSWLLVGLVGGQLVAGAANLLLRAPVWLQMVHLFLAYSLWIGLVILCAGVLKSDQVAADK